jgi:DNA-binding MarR family transcriptional regulator
MTGPDPALDPVIHAPARLRVMVTLAALPSRDSLSFSRLQELLGLTAGNLITHLRKLEDVGYVTSSKSRQNGLGHTAVSLTYAGRAALEQYTASLRQLLDQVPPDVGG